tara:strand:- start:1224 stop:2054 length:831 start_codon:yes stop_codon:yes gene_type:complete
MKESNSPFWLENPSVLFKKDKLTVFFPTNSMSPYEKMNSLTRLSIYLAIVLFIYNGKINDFFIPIITMLLFVVIYKGNKTQFDNLNINNKEDLTETTNTLTPDATATPSPSGVIKMTPGFLDSNTLIEDDIPKDIFKTAQDIRHEKEVANNITDISKVCVPPSQNNPFMNVLLTDYIKDPQRGPACPSYNNKNVQLEIEKDFDYNLYQGASDIYNKRNSQRQYYTTPGTTIPNDRESLLKWAYHLPATCRQGDGVGCLRLISDWSWTMRDVMPFPN